MPLAQTSWTVTAFGHDIVLPLSGIVVSIVGGLILISVGFILKIPFKLRNLFGKNGTTVNVYNGYEQGHQEGSSENPNSETEVAQNLEFYCNPKKRNGDDDSSAQASGVIRTFENEGVARVVVNWPSEVEKYWVKINSGSEVDAVINGESPGIRKNGSRFKVKDSFVQGWFDLELYHTEEIGRVQVKFNKESSGECLFEYAVSDSG